MTHADPPDARQLLESLVGRPLKTMTQWKVNTILRVEHADAIVATASSPSGERVSVASVQAAIDDLWSNREIRVDKELVGYRSAFIGAVLTTLPNVAIVETKPRRLRLLR